LGSLGFENRYRVTEHPGWIGERAAARPDSGLLCLHTVGVASRVLLRFSNLFRPEDILTVINRKPQGVDISPLADIFPTRGELEIMADSLPSNPPDPSLALNESIIPATSEFENITITGLKFDSRGYSPYIRVTSALLEYLADARSVAKENMWALRHVLILGQYANDFLSVPESPSGLFGSDVSRQDLRRLLAKVHQLSTYLLSMGDDSLHSQVVSACTATRTTTSSNALVSFAVDVVSYARREDTVRDSLVLRSVLKHLLPSASKSDSDQWLNLARRLEKTGATHGVMLWTMSV